MKKILILFSLTAIFNLGFTQTSINQTQKLATLCKVWGFLKYYHPKVAKGKYDWDKQLIQKIPLIESAKTKNEINKIYTDWITDLGKVKICKDCNNNIPDSLKYNLNLGWTTDTSIFNVELISKLNFIKENRNTKQGYYVRYNWYKVPTFDKEKPYKGMVFPSEEYRLLGLFRYWNIINYFYPYKYLIGEDWNTVLDEMIPKFLYPKDTVDYHMAMLELINSLNDSHAELETPYTRKYLGNYYPSFKFKIIDNKAIVISSWNDSLSKINDIKVGDVILKYNNIDVKDLLKEKEKYANGSNEPTKYRNLLLILLNSNIDTCRITYERNGQINSKTIKLYLFAEFHYIWNKSNKPVCEELKDNIGYVNMGKLEINQVDSVMKIMMNKKAIIFDVRCYPNQTRYAIANYLNKDRFPFVKSTNSDLSYPGVFKWEPNDYCGKINNIDYYKGKVVLLINESTQSLAELTCMALQTAPDVKCIGSQTASADADVITITLPGYYQTGMTAIGAYYPNGKETQRIGIVPDIEVHPTIEGIKNNKDEVLERAIKYINEGN
jgi:C-terminal processing protease CtpA/Prc